MQLNKHWYFSNSTAGVFNSSFLFEVCGLKTEVTEWRNIFPPESRKIFRICFYRLLTMISKLILICTIGEKKCTSSPQTHPEASPCPQPGCPSSPAGWLAPWWCLSRCSCQLAGCCGSASRSSRCGTPAGLNRTGAGLESRGCGDSAHSGRMPQYAGEDQRHEKDYNHDSIISDTFHLNTFQFFRQLAFSYLTLTSLLISTHFLQYGAGLHWKRSGLDDVFSDTKCSDSLSLKGFIVLHSIHMGGRGGFQSYATMLQELIMASLGIFSNPCLF